MTTSSYESLSHSKWDCKYHLVFIPKCRKKELYGKIRKYLGPLFHELAAQRNCKILEGHMVQDHVHMLIPEIVNVVVASTVKSHSGLCSE
jgi:putative transposase